MYQQSAQFVVFDLDGTLVDSVSGLHLAAVKMLNHFDADEVTEEEVRNWVGRGIPKLVKSIMSSKSLLDEQVSDDDETFQKAHHVFLQCYEQTLTSGVEIYAGVPELLDRLKTLDIPMAILTNKNEALSHQLLVDLKIRHYFEILVGGDTLTNKKPFPDGLYYIADHLGMFVESGLMVGDSAVDVETARSAGCPVVVTDYGYNGGKPIADSNPDAIVSSLNELIVEHPEFEQV